eukprot:1129502-Amphidinium_carterae.1
MSSERRSTYEAQASLFLGQQLAHLREEIEQLTQVAEPAPETSSQHTSTSNEEDGRIARCKLSEDE